jgi:MFS family permease
MILLGSGVGLSFPALFTLAMSGATQSDAGLASGLVNTTLQVGGALGLAVLATLATIRTETLRDAGDSAAAALNGGFHLAYVIGAGLVLTALAVALTVLQPEHKAAKAAEAEAAELACAEPAYSEAM